ncbi:glycosyltransferase [Mariniflexile litorale]|uniref:Glycosyltransferase n=1 Tax=Mariniflexile litorale TaxID=3045158 RepID=A0AAU7EEG0_9FLAO|nr:glycosyltransferase [Mariniflexile sp. KMM 9835]MDQ8212225.1 glycosyltransferase [Mariniflexile sp. KMM 9835]
MKLLFITHDASRSGAPLILLYFIKWLNTHSKNVDCDLLFVHGGVLESDFKKECNEVFYVKKGHKPLKFSELIWIKIKKKLGLRAKNTTDELFTVLANNHYDLIYANTIISVPFGVQIKNRIPNVKLLLHIHELNTQIKILLPNFNQYKGNIDCFIAASNIVKNNLVNNWNVSEDLIEVIYEFSVVKQFETPKSKTIFTVGASGLSYWRKGNDIFLQVASHIKNNYPDAKIKFVWVGNEFRDKPIIDADIIKLGLKQYVHFVGEKEHPYEEFMFFDVFLLSSREDPFPLVCIEIANLEKPIICFEKASGTAEVVSKGGGYVVPYLDIKAMADKVMYYYNNPDKVNDDGRIAKKMFSEFTPDNKCPLIYQKIKDLL